MRSSRVVQALGLGAFVAVLVSAGACGDDRGKFVEPNTFGTDASTPEAPVCGFQCSLDGRSIIDTCTSEVVETCPPELACGAATCQEPCAAAAADGSSNGCEFYFQLPRLDGKNIPESCFATFIVNSSTQPVTLSLEREGRALDLSGALYRADPETQALSRHEGPIAPGDSAILFVSDRDPEGSLGIFEKEFYISCPDGVVPALVADHGTVGTAIGYSFHLKASAPIGMTAMFPFGGAKSWTPTATLLFPSATWGNEHIIVNAWESMRTGDPGVQIVASEDETDVTIDPVRDIQDGVGVVGTLAHVPVTYRLSKGQHLQLVQAEELSGSTLTSTKPITLFGGHTCAFVPTNSSACDILNQQLPAFAQWGHEYVGVGYRPRLGDENEPVPYRIVAARDGTILDYDPEVPDGAPTMMSAGQVATFSAGTGEAFVVRTQDAEHPIYLAAYMTSARGGYKGAETFGGRGDPEFVNVVPAGQYLSSYSFWADVTYPETSLVVVRAKTGGAFRDVWLECAGNLTDWRPVGTRGEYEFVRVDLARDGAPGDYHCRNGLHRMRSDGPFTATIWGWGEFASYAYPGGMAQRKLVETPLAPVR